MGLQTVLQTLFKSKAPIDVPEFLLPCFQAGDKVRDACLFVRYRDSSFI